MTHAAAASAPSSSSSVPESNGVAIGASATLTTMRAAIDATTKAPVLALMVSALVWLVVGLSLTLIASIKTHSPDFLDGIGFLTYGRVHAAGWQALAYGWVGLSGLGLAVWATPRMARRPDRLAVLPKLATLLWNAAVAIGVVGILAGYGTGVPFLEFPRVPSMMLAAAMGIMASWTLATLFTSDRANLYLSQWLIAIALVVFPTVFVAARALLFDLTITGLSAVAIHQWYLSAGFGLWIAPLSLASLFFVFPKAINRPVSAYSFAFLGMWTFVLSYNLMGPLNLAITALPTGLVALSTVARTMAGFGVALLTLSLLITLAGSGTAFRISPVARFCTFAAIAFPITTVLLGLQTTRSVSAVVQFSLYPEGQAWLAMLGLYTWAMAGAIYWIVPRLTGWEWPSVAPIKLHLTTALGGVTLIWLALTLRGIAQGVAINTPSISFAQIQSESLVFFWGVSLGLGALLLGALTFLATTTSCVLRLGPRAAAAIPLAEPLPSRRSRHVQSTSLVIFGGLAAVLVSQFLVATFLQGLGRLPMIAILVSLAATYVILIAWYMMYLKYEGRWIFAMLVPTCVISTLLVIAIFPDAAMPYSIDPAQATTALAAPASTALQP